MTKKEYMRPQLTAEYFSEECVITGSGAGLQSIVEGAKDGKIKVDDGKLGNSSEVILFDFSL